MSNLSKTDRAWMMFGWTLAVIVFPVTLFFVIRSAVYHVRYIRFMQAVKAHKETNGIS